MKSTLLLALIGLLNFTSFGQDTEQLNLFYIMDDFQYTGSTKTYKTDDSPNYLQIVDNEMAFTTRLRGKEYLIMGTVTDVVKTIDADGNERTKFFVIGEDRTLGKRRSFEIVEDIKGHISLHYFHSLGQEDITFSAHHASMRERTDIVNYWAGVR